MKKMKRLNLNKVRIVSLKNLEVVNGGQSGAPCADTHTCPAPTTTLDPDTCYSTSNTYAGGDDGNAGTTFRLQTQACSMVLTECELADM